MRPFYLRFLDNEVENDPMWSRDKIVHIKLTDIIIVIVGIGLTIAVSALVWWCAFKSQREIEKKVIRGQASQEVKNNDTVANKLADTSRPPSRSDTKIHPAIIDKLISSAKVEIDREKSRGRAPVPPKLPVPPSLQLPSSQKPQYLTSSSSSSSSEKHRPSTSASLTSLTSSIEWNRPSSSSSSIECVRRPSTSASTAASVFGDTNRPSTSASSIDWNRGMASTSTSSASTCNNDAQVGGGKGGGNFSSWMDNTASRPATSPASWNDCKRPSTSPATSEWGRRSSSFNRSRERPNPRRTQAFQRMAGSVNLDGIPDFPLGAGIPGIPSMDHGFDCPRPMTSPDVPLGGGRRNNSRGGRGGVRNNSRSERDPRFSSGFRIPVFPPSEEFPSAPEPPPLPPMKFESIPRGAENILESLCDVARKKTPSERKKLWKKLLLKWHPDKNPNKTAECLAVFQYLVNKKEWFISLEDNG